MTIWNGRMFLSHTPDKSATAAQRRALSVAFDQIWPRHAEESWKNIAVDDSHCTLREALWEYLEKEFRNLCCHPDIQNTTNTLKNPWKPIPWTVIGGVHSGSARVQYVDANNLTNDLTLSAQGVEADIYIHAELTPVLQVH
ncbi:MAG: hypothetical protein ACIARR_13265 [Phycisphaerales bacterium JB059]